MACDAKEIPRPLIGDPDSLWWAHLCGFDGMASPGGETGNVGEPEATQFDGTKLGGGKAAMAIADGKLLGILAPVDDGQPALWWAWPLSKLDIATSGSQGVFTKRPRTIELTGPTGWLVLGKVDKIYRSASRRDPRGQPLERLHGNEENAFLAAVGGS
jgi:hypothetical protein